MDAAPETDSRSERIQRGPLKSAVFLLAFPVLCEQGLSFCVGFFDTWLSGRFSSEATTAIGVVAYVGWLVSMLYGLVAVGTTALVSRNIGAGDRTTANAVMNRSIGLAILLGWALAASVWWIADTLSGLLGMTGTTAELVARYLRRDAIGLAFYGVGLTGAAALRGSGDMRTPLLVLGLVSVVNMLGSCLLVFGWGPVAPGGVDGIIWGTVIARAFGGLLMLAVLVQGRGCLRLGRACLRLVDPVVRRILRIGGPAAVDGFIMWSGHFLFLRIIAQLGRGDAQSRIFAAHVIGIEVEAITYLPAVAWGAAAATMIGQCLGAGNPERAQEAGRTAARQCSLLALFLTIVFLLGADSIYRFMHADSTVHEVGIPAFRMLACFQIPLVICIVYTAALRGAGDSRTPMILTCISVLGIRVPLAWYFGVFLSGGLSGAWIGMCADVTFRAVMVRWRFHRGNWARIEV